MLQIIDIDVMDLAWPSRERVENEAGMACRRLMAKKPDASTIFLLVAVMKQSLLAFSGENKSEIRVPAIRA